MPPFEFIRLCQSLPLALWPSPAAGALTFPCFKATIFTPTFACEDAHV